MYSSTRDRFVPFSPIHRSLNCKLRARAHRHSPAHGFSEEMPVRFRGMDGARDITPRLGVGTRIQRNGGKSDRRGRVEGSSFSAPAYEFIPLPPVNVGEPTRLPLYNNAGHCRPFASKAALHGNCARARRSRRDGGGDGGGDASRVAARVFT